MNNPSPIVSIIIPVFNEEKNIVECVESLLQQSYLNKEIIVVDDGSTDRSLYKIKDLPIKILSQSHQGPAIARNTAAKKAKGEILVFMDADMIFSKDFLRDLVVPILNGQYKGTFSKEEYVKNWENVWARCWNYNLNRLNKRMIPLDYPDEGMDFRAILKSEFEKVKGFEDVGYTDTWSLYQKLGYKPHSVKGAIYFHKNPDSLMDVFLQSKWAAKRSYKMGVVGKFFVLSKLLFPVSLIIGLFKSIKYKEPGFLPFKIIYDLGAFLGILEMIALGKTAK